MTLKGSGAHSATITLVDHDERLKRLRVRMERSKRGHQFLFWKAWPFCTAQTPFSHVIFQTCCSQILEQNF